jgi:cell wall-associated NlpC family hydrolase
MDYRAVKNRCAVDLDSLRLSITREETLAILAEKGFRAIEVDLVALARGCIGRSKYRRGARPSEAPDVVDCSSFIKWLYAQRGIWLPRRSIQQREFGETVDLSQLAAGDVVFVSGLIDYYFSDPADGVGHVGIYAGEEKVIHAANGKIGVTETALDKFIGNNGFRGARRYLPKGKEIFTFAAPPEREIETADDIRWIVLQSFPQKHRS